MQKCVGTDVVIDGNALGLVELTFTDTSDRENRTRDLVYSVGIVRPPKDAKDDVSKE